MPPLNERFALFPYACAVFFISLWWFLAFMPRGTLESSASLIDTQSEFNEALDSPYLASLSRSRLHKALLGDVDLMAGLIAEWEAEAELLQQSKLAHPLRLTRAQFLRAQALSHKIRRRRSGLQDMSIEVSCDQERLETSRGIQRYLPQTYVAASFLLALTSPEEIVALPHDMRQMTQLYPKELLDPIKLDLTPYNTERLWQARPSIAFVASYSHPSTCSALRQQGIELCTLSEVNSIEQVQAALLQVGDKIDRKEEAELLSLFMEAALCALDNRLLLHQQTKSKLENVLYVNYFSYFTAPSQRTLTGKLLKRLNINGLSPLQAQGHTDWQIPPFV